MDAHDITKVYQKRTQGGRAIRDFIGVSKLTPINADPVIVFTFLYLIHVRRYSLKTGDFFMFFEGRTPFIFFRPIRLIRNCDDVKNKNDFM